MAKKTARQRERETREKMELPAPVIQPIEGSAQVLLQHRQAKHRSIARVQARLEAGDDGTTGVPLRAKLGLGAMAASVKKRSRG